MQQQRTMQQPRRRLLLLLRPSSGTASSRLALLLLGVLALAVGLVDAFRIGTPQSGGQQQQRGWVRMELRKPATDARARATQVRGCIYMRALTCLRPTDLDRSNQQQTDQIQTPFSPQRPLQLQQLLLRRLPSSPKVLSSLLGLALGLRPLMGGSPLPAYAAAEQQQAASVVAPSASAAGSTDGKGGWWA